MSNENKVRKDALFFLDVGAENHPNKDGIITVLVSYDNKEQIKSLKELATGILNWIEKNEKADNEKSREAISSECKEIDGKKEST